MSDYAPKTGDTIRASAIRQGAVQHVYTNGVLISTGELLSFTDGWGFELIEAAPVPFVVGGPITPEMGEPPVKSVVGFTGGDLVWLRIGDEWYPPGTDSPIAWADLKPRETMVLLRLGSGSTT